jgi:hypothetical protein
MHGISVIGDGRRRREFSVALRAQHRPGREAHADDSLEVMSGGLGVNDQLAALAVLDATLLAHPACSGCRHRTWLYDTSGGAGGGALAAALGDAGTLGWGAERNSSMAIVAVVN